MPTTLSFALSAQARPNLRMPEEPWRLPGFAGCCRCTCWLRRGVPTGSGIWVTRRECGKAREPYRHPCNPDGWWPYAFGLPGWELPPADCSIKSVFDVHNCYSTTIPLAATGCLPALFSSPSRFFSGPSNINLGCSASASVCRPPQDHPNTI